MWKGLKSSSYSLQDYTQFVVHTLCMTGPPYAWLNKNVSYVGVDKSIISREPNHSRNHWVGSTWAILSVSYTRLFELNTFSLHTHLSRNSSPKNDISSFRFLDWLPYEFWFIAFWHVTVLIRHEGSVLYNSIRY